MLLLFILTCTLVLCKNYNTTFCIRHYIPLNQGPVTRIALGSCASENKPQPILNTVVSKNPDLFIYLGDNVYCDTKNMDEMRNEYSKLSCKSEFQNLVSSMPILATWDDHDYGWNDSGLEYPLKEASKDIFLEFWGEPDTSSRWNHPGIYHAVYIGDSARRVQILLLDCRTFRTSQTEINGNYVANPSPSASILGSEQWAWLEQELLKPAAIRIVCSSTQFGAELNGWETWDNYPLEVQCMANLIQQTQAEHLMFISGDVHYAELSKRTWNGLYPIYDFTSSGLTNIENVARPNAYRIGNPVQEPHAGMISIDWTNQLLLFEVFNVAGTTVYSHTVTLSELEF